MFALYNHCMTNVQRCFHGCGRWGRTADVDAGRTAHVDAVRTADVDAGRTVDVDAGRVVECFGISEMNRLVTLR